MILHETDASEMSRKVRSLRPLVQCITNHTTVNDCANLLLAAGASPTIAHHPEEMEEIQQGCSALVCNLGALEDLQAMKLAVKTAAACGHPIVIDPVGCGGSSFRRKSFRELVAAGRPSCIRGNASEIEALAKNSATVTGVDAAASALEQTRAAAMRLAQELGCMVIASGAVDIITDGKTVFEEPGGDEMMPLITGTGCMESCLLAAYLAAENSLQSAACCMRAMALCGERAAAQTRREGKGTMTFRTHFIDEMYLLERE